MSRNRIRNLSLGLLLFVLAGALSAQGAVEPLGSSLTEKQQLVVSIASFTANGDLENLDRVVNQGLDAGLSVNEIGEIILQMYAYAGFPRSLNGVSVLTAAVAKRQAEGKRDNFGVEPDLLPEGTDKYALGVANLAQLMGFPYSQQKGASSGYNTTMDVFLKEHLFADIFGRNNLSFDLRELATVGGLCSLEGTASQLMFHMNAAMTMGISEEQMHDLVFLVRDELGTERGDSAEKVLGQVLARRNGSAGGPAPAAAGYAYVPELFPRGQVSTNTTIFTGNAWVAPLVPFDSGSVPIVNVTFEPGARTTWHAHSYLQVLLVTLGQGYYQEEGQEPRALRAGDSVVIPPGVKHWHGSAPGQWFAHVTVLVQVESDAQDQWLDPVDSEYYSGL